MNGVSTWVNLLNMSPLWVLGGAKLCLYTVGTLKTMITTILLWWFGEFWFSEKPVSNILFLKAS